MFSPVMKSSGPSPARIAIVGEAPGQDEAVTGRPFTGTVGHELTLLLRENGINRSECFLTNVFFSRPEGNRVENFFVKKKEGLAHLPPLSMGKYLHPSLAPELERLERELLACAPNLIIALGNTACWAILGTGGISKLRGSITWSEKFQCKVLPTYHPAFVLRSWESRPIVSIDFKKAAREYQTKALSYPNRRIITSPDLDDIREWMHGLDSATILSVDIETKRGQITLVGFAASKNLALVVPFWDEFARRSYWPTLEAERAAWLLVRTILAHPVPKLFQNGMYDMQYFFRNGIRVRNALHDTMLLHHALYPEMEKGLGFLGSIYTNEQSWKLLRPRGKEELKLDE